MLRHPNVIQFLGVYYPTVAGGANMMRLPVMVMEMMADSLTSFVDIHEKISVHIKYSIVHDVSLGLCYLHNHDPPIVHCDLSPNNVLLTTHHVAKISDLGVAKVIKTKSRKTMTRAPGIVDFMAPEGLIGSPVYGPPMDVFSFAGIILYTFNQQWPTPTQQIQFDPKTRRLLAFSEVDRRQEYLDKMIGEAEVLRPLVEECLDNDPAIRPTIPAICERIQLNKDAYKESPQDNITLDLIVTQRAPPLIPTLIDGWCHIRWTQLADLPFSLYNLHVAAQRHKIYITGISPIEDAEHQVYVYDINTDQWGQLPSSGHYKGVPHIIGGRLAIIGGCLSTTKKKTNKVSTFNEGRQTWTSYYPDLLSIRSKPGVVSYAKHVIVAGGARPAAEDDDSPVVQDDIEVLNWEENSHWRKVSIKLPVPMYGFTPTISDDHLLIVGYRGKDMKSYKSVYEIIVTKITSFAQQDSDTLTKWTELTEATHYGTALIPSSSPPVVVGGENTKGTTTDINMYDNFKKSWKKVGLLSSARSDVAVATVNDKAIIVIGGYSEGDTKTNRKSSSLKVVELGQAELIY